MFIELRHLNQNGADLHTLVDQALSINKFEQDTQYVQRAMQAGHFVFLLDGFDEVIQSKRQQISRAIQEFARRHDKNAFVISSRPDSELDGWQDFAVLRLEALTLELADELVARLDYDDELKKKFRQDLHDELFEKHKSFLSNPLLLSIMLLTYGQSANIPDKLNVFYNQAYEALFERHDALKGGFRRERRTKLDIQILQEYFRRFACRHMTRANSHSHILSLSTNSRRPRQLQGLSFQRRIFSRTCSKQCVCW